MRKRRILSGIIAAAVAMGGFGALPENAGLSGWSITASAASSGKCGENVTWSLNNDGTLTISGSGETNSYSSKSLSPFYGNSAVKKAVIEDGIVSIGNSMFDGCSGLESITIPDSVTKIGDTAFKNCRSLKSISIPKYVSSIGSDVFYNADSLTDIYFGGCRARVRWALDNIITFMYTEDATRDFLSVGENVNLHYTEEYPATVIDSGECGDNATWTLYDEGTVIISGTGDMYNDSLSESIFGRDYIPQEEYRFPVVRRVVIEDGITSVGDYSFSGFAFLEKITFGRDVASVGIYAFSHTSIEKIVIPGNVKTIGNRAFESCPIRSVVLEDGVERVMHGAFKGNYTTMSVSIPDSVKYIDDYAFYWYNHIKSFTIPNSVEHLGYNCFGDIVNTESYEITDVYYEGTEEEWNSIEYSLGEESIGDGHSDYSSYSLRDFVGIPREATLHFLGDDAGIDPDTVPDGGLRVSESNLKSGEEFTVYVDLPKTAKTADTVQFRVTFDPDVYEVVSWYSNDESSPDCISKIIPNGVVNYDNDKGYFSLASVGCICH